MPDDPEKLLQAIELARQAGGLKGILQKALKDKKSLSVKELAMLDQFEAEILEKQDKEEASPSGGDDGADFDNLTDVYLFLQSAGWKVSKATVYKHGKEGYLARKDGRYSRKAVLKYATNFLKLRKTDRKVKEEDLQARKLRAEIQLREAQAKREKLKLMEEQGELLRRQDVHQELAGRAAVQDHAWTHKFHTGAADVIDLVSGDQGKEGELIALFMTWKNEVFNDFATAMEFEVVLKKTED